MSDTTLRSGLIRLAHANPNLRPHLLPLLAGHEKRASFDLRYKINHEVAEEEAKIMPRVIAKHMGVLQRELRAKFPKWDVKVDYEYTKPEGFGLGGRFTENNGSMSISVEVDRDSHEDFFTDIEDLEKMDEWLRSTCDVDLDLGFGGVYALEPSDFPIKGGGNFTL